MGPRLRQLHTRALPNGIVDLLRQVAFMALAYVAYMLVRGAADDPQGAAIAFDNARRIIELEEGLHIFVEPAVQSWAARVPGLLDACSWIYINAQTSVTLGALVYLYLFHNASFYFVSNMFAVALSIALLGYLVYKTAPPRFLPEWGFFDAVAQFTGVAHDEGVATLFNPYAAVPSMHVAFALMVAGPVARLARRRLVRAVWAAYPSLVTVSVLATANHWWLDAAAGAATAAVAAGAACWLAARRPAAWRFRRAQVGAA